VTRLPGFGVTSPAHSPRPPVGRRTRTTLEAYLGTRVRSLVATHVRTHTMTDVRSIEMNTMHEQLARQRCEDAQRAAREHRLVRALRANRRAHRAESSARNAYEVARRATDRAVLV
jgi:hypothetical protein